MTTVLITNGVDPDVLCLERCRLRLRLRLLARLRSNELDQLLACGVSADTDVLLSINAHTLHSAVTRKRLARELRRIVDDSARPYHPFDSTLPLAQEEIRRSQDLLRDLADALECSEPVDPRGVAQTKLLLRDGDSPLYRPQLTGSLRPALQQAIDSLTMPPTQPCDDLIGVS